MVRKFFSLLGFVLAVLGAAVLVACFINPERTASYFEEAKTYVKHEVAQVNERVTGELPVVRYHTDGGLKQLDRAPWGQFVRMVDYQKVTGVPETWAAHNGLGGDFIVPWEVGQRFRVEGGSRDGEWIVVDVKSVPKYSTVDKMLPVKGDLVLQTCFYIHSKAIKLIGAVRVEDYESGNVWENVLGKTREQVIEEKRKAEEAQSSETSAPQSDPTSESTPTASPEELPKLEVN